MLSAGKQRQIDAALQCQAGAGTADNAGTADEEYFHAAFVTESHRPFTERGAVVRKMDPIHQRLCTSGRIFSS